ncbi:MFS transporter [Streptomyces sp. TX20-6-3]|uniref:MFS transporter n=1 Tax=Streptomyces sp. TX20-6-3 TaxID=3028705 RepID=UPI0029A73441|nr:MFS transporter [Streptomyces sp. TX20-6-3]MDX2565305.1 MFS transporter [Streptomyces sp. TX20-6-3]
MALGADALSAVGTGLTLPFLMVYLHAVRGLGLGVAGAATAMVALAGLVGNPVGGAWVDRSGPRRVLAAGWGVAAAGACGLAVASQPWQAFAAAAVSGIGAALALPAQDALLVRLVTEQGRSGVFALRHATLNLGLALGGLISAWLVDLARPESFVLLYMFDAASFALAVLLLGLVRGNRGPAAPQTGGGAPDANDSAGSGGYAAVVRDRLFVRLWVLLAVLVAVGFAQFNASFPVLVTGAGLSAGVAGLAFTANTVTVTVVQLIVLRLARGRRRTAAIVALCGLWALSWALVLAGGQLHASAAAIAFILAAVTFALGETLFAPTLPALINGIAPEALRGRYNGAAGFAYTVGFAAGPALAGVLLQHGLTTPLLVGLLVACGGAALLARSVKRQLPAGADLIDPPSTAPASAEPGAVPTSQEASA